MYHSSCPTPWLTPQVMHDKQTSYTVSKLAASATSASFLLLHVS